MMKLNQGADAPLLENTTMRTQTSVPANDGSSRRDFLQQAAGLAAGGKLQWLCLGKPDWDQNPDRIADAARHQPIGIAPHGALAERLHRQNRLGVLTDLLKRIRDQGVLVGLSAHNPALIDLVEDKGWDVDYFMCCLYYLTRPREEYQKLLSGELPLGEIYLASDQTRMFIMLQQELKTC